MGASGDKEARSEVRGTAGRGSGLLPSDGELADKEQQRDTPSIGLAVALEEEARMPSIIDDLLADVASFFRGPERPITMTLPGVPSE